MHQTVHAQGARRAGLSINRGTAAYFRNDSVAQLGNSGAPATSSAAAGAAAAAVAAVAGPLLGRPEDAGPGGRRRVRDRLDAQQQLAVDQRALLLQQDHDAASTFDALFGFMILTERFVQRHMMLFHRGTFLSTYRLI